MAKDLDLAIRITAKDSTAGALGKTRAGLQSISRELALVRNAFLGLQGVMGLQAGISGLAKLADAVQSTNARLKLAVGTVREFAQAQQFAYRVAAQTGAGFEAVATLYTRLATTAKGFGLSQERIAAVTEATALALKVSGASAAESAGAVRQFAQALGSGVLRGDEFNSLMEQAPRLMQALADGLGVPIGRLRQLAEQGLLTTDVVVQAIESQREAITREAEAMPRTIGQSLSQVRDEFGRTIDAFNQASGATRIVGAAFDALARHMDAIAGTGLVAAVGAITVAITRTGIAAKERVAAMLAEIAAERQATATAIAHARAKVSYAQAELAAAQAAVASATGMARLAVVENTLVPAQQRLAAAQAGLNAAMAAGTGIAGGLRAALAFLGGPLGIILTLLTAGATAWTVWGDKAESAADKARAAIDRAREASERLARERKFGTGDAADLREAIELLEKRKAVLEETARVTYRGRPSEQLQAKLDRVNEDLAQFRAALAEIEQRDGASAPGAPTEAGRALLRKQWDAYIAQYETGADRLKRAIDELREKAKEAGISEASPEFRKALDNLKRSLGGGAAAGLAAARQQADAELAVLKDGLERQQRALDEALADRLVSIRDYYAQKTAIERREINAEIARQAALLAEARRTQSDPLASESDRLRARAEVARIEAELIILNRKRADIEQANARASARAERELADVLAAAREELAKLTGTDTAADRRAAIERSYSDLRARLIAESDTAGVQIIDRLIDVKAAQANLARLEQEWRLVTERLRNAQEAIQIQSQAGLLTEAQARRQIVALQQQSAAEMERLLPAMQQAAQAIGPDAVSRVAAWRNELERTRLVTDELAPLWNRIGESFGNALQGMVTGAQTLREGLSSIFRSISDAFLQQLVIQPFQQWMAMQARMLAARLGFVQQEQAIEQAAAAQSVATKSAETTAKVSMDAAQAGAGAAASQASIPVVGPGLALAAMAAMVAAVMALLGNVKKFASGGYVTGPGTSTSDSIPARLSAGEYVVRAAAVKRVGVAFLDAINGLKAPPGWDGQRLAFAAGGLVPAVNVPPAQPQVNQAVRIVNAIDPGVTHDHLQTPAGERVILNIIGRNARAVRAALQG